MSLINKMLQDLDARGGDGARGDASSSVRPVGYAPRRGLPAAAVGAGVVALAVLGVGGYAAYKYFRGGGQPVVASVASQPVQAGRAAEAISDEAARQRDERIAAARRAAEEQGAASPENPENRGVRPDAARKTTGRGAGTDDVPDTRAPGVADRKHEGATKRRTTPAADGGQARSVGAKGATTAARDGRAADAVEKRTAKASTAAASAVRSADGAARGAGTAAGSEQGLSSQQKAENEYRRALASLQDARVNDAMAGLEQAVYLYPRHEAARQTLVSLLIESGRPAEAMRHMTFATSLDPRQVNMAMLLARLQLEHGGNAAETLQRSLPYAESNADYRALIAGVLQRQNRHKEAADHYQTAVRLQPGNAVWWMGMGISLQAEKRNAEAKIAFQRAHDTGRLSPELQTFVERRLQQLN